MLYQLNILHLKKNIIIINIVNFMNFMNFIGKTQYFQPFIKCKFTETPSKKLSRPIIDSNIMIMDEPCGKIHKNRNHDKRRKIDMYLAILKISKITLYFKTNLLKFI